MGPLVQLPKSKLTASPKLSLPASCSRAPSTISAYPGLEPPTLRLRKNGDCEAFHRTIGAKCAENLPVSMTVKDCHAIASVLKTFYPVVSFIIGVVSTA